MSLELALLWVLGLSCFGILTWILPRALSKSHTQDEDEMGEAFGQMLTSLRSTLEGIALETYDSRFTITLRTSPGENCEKDYAYALDFEIMETFRIRPGVPELIKSEVDIGSARPAKWDIEFFSIERMNTSEEQDLAVLFERGRDRTLGCEMIPEERRLRYCFAHSPSQLVSAQEYQRKLKLSTRVSPQFVDGHVLASGTLRAHVIVRIDPQLLRQDWEGCPLELGNLEFQPLEGPTEDPPYNKFEFSRGIVLPDQGFTYFAKQDAFSPLP